MASLEHTTFRSKYFGDRAFYRRLLVVVLPIIAQNGITNLAALIDNIMVGMVGTEQMSGVSIANELLFVFNLCVFGAVAGPDIFGAQFFGKGDTEGVRHTFRYKFVVGLVLAAIGVTIYLSFDEPLIKLYLTGEGAVGDIEKTLASAKDYLHILIFGLVPFVLTQIYSGTLRECNDTATPMRAGLIGVGVNVLFNYLLIFGSLGFPRLGVRGAAIATVLSRVVEATIIITRAHTGRGISYEFAHGAYKGLFRVPKKLIGSITLRGLPMIFNETLWAAAQAILLAEYSRRGLVVVGALNIATTVSNLFSTVYMAMGVSIGIIVGQQLGAGDLEGAKDTDRKMIVTSLFLAVSIGGVMAAVSPLIPMIYKTSHEVRSLAAALIRIIALLFPIQCLLHNLYFTLRTGGKTFITFLFDSAFAWVVSVPSALLFTRFTSLPILPLYALVQSMEWIKCVIGIILVKRGVWLNNIVAKENTSSL